MITSLVMHGLTAFGLVLFFTALAPAQSISLSGNWRCNDGGTYNIIQSGKSIQWVGRSADNGALFTNEFQGTIDGNQIVGTWKDRPPGRVRQSGELNLQIVSVDHLTAGRQQLPFSGTEWTRNDGQIVGSWRRCDGGVLKFTFENGDFVGRYAILGPDAAPFHFRAGQVFARVQQTGPSRYDGQALFRNTNGSSGWEHRVYTISRGRLSVEGGYDCNINMARIGASGPVLPAATSKGAGSPNDDGHNAVQPDGTILGAWQGCDGSVVLFAYQEGEYTRRTTKGEVTGRFHPVRKGKYSGQVLIRAADGRSEWRPGTLTLSEGRLSDSRCSMTPAGTGTGRGVTGNWNTNWGPMWLTQTDAAVNGTYRNNGRMEGTVSGNVFRGTWSDSRGAGTFTLPLSIDKDSFDGPWTRLTGVGNPRGTLKGVRMAVNSSY